MMRAGATRPGVVGRGVADEVGDLNRGDHAEVKGLDRFGEVEAAGELVGCGPSGRVGGGGRDRGADLAGCSDQRRVGTAGWAGEFTPAFRRPAPCHLVGVQCRRQSLENIAVDMALSGGGFGDDVRGAGDGCLHAGYANRISRVRVGGQGAVRLNLPASQSCLEPSGRCRFSHLVRVG